MRSHETLWKCKKINVSEKKKRFKLHGLTLAKWWQIQMQIFFYFGNILFIQEGFVFQNGIANFIFVFLELKSNKKRVYYRYILNASYLLFNYLI